jgi:hypothetical protein
MMAAGREDRRRPLVGSWEGWGRGGWREGMEG